MKTIFKLKRCLKADLPAEGGMLGEVCYCNDTDELVIGEGITNPWTVFASKAVTDWTSKKKYSAGAVVISGNKIYRCINTHESSNDFEIDINNWNLLIEGFGKALSTLGGTMVGDIIMSDGTAIVPATAEGATLGTADKPFKDVFVGAHSIYVNGNKVIDSENTTINVTTNTDQHLAVHTTGLGTTRIASTKEVILYSGGDINHQALGDFEILSKGRVSTLTDVDGQDILFETQGVLSNITFKSKHEVNFDAPSVNFNSVPKVNGTPIGGDTYSHPSTHPATIIEEDPDNRFVTDAQITNWNDKYTKIETDTRIQAIVDGAPEAYNTLKEIADYIAQDQSAGASILASLGNKVDKEAGKGLSSNDYTNIDKGKVHDHANKNILDQVGESTGGNFTYKGIEISGGSGGTTDHNSLTNRNIDNQHTINAIQGLQAELDKKVSVITGKGLSSNDYDNTAKNKVDNLSVTQAVDLDAVKSASHTHTNTSVLGKIGEDANGNILYNNNPVNGKLANARTIGLSGKVTGTATSFDGSSNISIPVTSVTADSCTGNSATATKLQTPVSINGIPFDGSANIDIPMNTNTNTNTNTNANTNSPGYFSRDIPFYASGKLTIATPNQLWVNIAKNWYMLETQKTFDISVDASWDSAATLWQANHDYAVNDVVYPSETRFKYYYRCTTAGTSSTIAPKTTLGATCNDGSVVWICELDFTVAENRKGKDFYIYSCIPANGTEPIIVLSANSTVPLRYTADTSRKIGGFHTLCADVGTIAWHKLSGYVAGNILPASVWDLKHRPVCSPEGMVFIDGMNVWMGIYFLSMYGTIYDKQLVTVNNGVIADGGASPISFNDFDFVEILGKQRMRLPSNDEFTVATQGNPQGAAIAADPNYTGGGHVSTSNVRLISNYGIEDGCGVMWTWCREFCYNSASYRLTAGGCWSNGTSSSSRYFNYSSVGTSKSAYAARAVSEPLAT